MFGEVDLPVKIGPHIFTSTFFIMDIQPAYCCFLGRPCIHKAGEVTSTLYQKIKYSVNGKTVTVYGEEEYIVSHLSSFRHVEIEGQLHETPFQGFKIVQMIKTPRSKDRKKPETSLSSLKDAQAMVKAGHPKGWGSFFGGYPKV